MPIHDIQSSFAGGELAPTLQGRVDLAKYKTGLKTCRNMIPGNHGEVYNRPGTRFIHRTYFDAFGGTSRLIPFVFSQTETYILEFTINGNAIVVYKNGTFVERPRPAWSSAVSYVVEDLVTLTILGTPYVYKCIQANSNKNPETQPAYWQLFLQDEYPVLITSPYTSGDLSKIKYCQSLDTLYLTHPDFPPYVITRTSDTAWSISLFEFKNGPFMLQNTDEDHLMNIGTIGGFLTVSSIHKDASPFNYFVSGHVGSLFYIKEYQQQSAYNAILDNDATGTSIPCMNNWQLVTSGTWDGLLTLQKSTDGGTTWTNLKSWTSHGDLNVNTYGTEDNPDGVPFLLRTVMDIYPGLNHPITINLSADAFYQRTVFKVTELVNSWQAKIEIMGDLHNLNSSSYADWAEGSWSTYRGWPATVSFFMDRLAFAGSKSEPQTTWLSKVGIYVDFGISSPLIDSDAISVNLPSRELNFIQSMQAFQNYLMLNTSGGEWTISSVGGGPITPTTVVAKLHGVRGSNGIDPLRIGNKVLFIEPKGSAVREMNYDFYSDSFVSNNISLLSSHLFDNHDIKRMVFAQEPKSIIWFVRDDGILISCTYIPEQEMLAYAWHDTDGIFEDACAIPGTYGHELWLVVTRGTHHCIERMLPRIDSTDPAEQYFVDSGIAYEGTPISTISGLPHLEDVAVSILADGFVLPQQIVNDASVDLGDSYSKVAVGVPYLSDIETLVPEIPMRDGTSQGRKYHLAAAVFRLYNSRGGKYGMDSDTLNDEFVTRGTDVPYDTPTPLYTGFYPDSGSAAISQGPDPRGHIMIRQADPLPITIVGIYPIIDQGDKP